MNEEDLLYYNGFGGFRSDGKEYIIKTFERTTLMPWSHIIANENFGTLITANGGGYVWHNNSQLNKITSWSNDCVKDAPSERLYIVLENRKIALLPYDSLSNYTIVYGFGYAKYIYEDSEIKTEVLIYVPQHLSKKVYDISIQFKNNEKESIEIDYSIAPVLGANREFTKKHLVIKENNNCVIIKNRYREDYAYDDVKIYSSGKISLNSSNDGIMKMSILSKKTNIQIVLSCQDDKEVIEDCNLLMNTKEELKKISNYWKAKIDKVKIKTPVKSMNLIMNGWLLYQTLCCRLWARTSFYQAGGAYGFRDQIQDALSIMWFDEDITKKQIILHAKHQFEEGDVLHWWHPERNSGTRTRYSDDLLWLPYVLSKYVEFTNDISILDEKVAYATGDLLNENEVEKYINAGTTLYEDTIFNHAKKAIKYGVQLSQNGLPKMNGGDWNDGMNQIKGESIWLGFFIYKVLDEFKRVCKIKEDFENVMQYEKWQEELKKGLNEYGWDGEWYRRAYFQTGEVVGSKQNKECIIDGISQSWAVISRAGDLEKCNQAMKNVDEYLVDRENKIIKLLTPPFDETYPNPGYIKDYIPGVRENGGQYTHGAIWSIIANCMLDNRDLASEYFNMLNPIEHTKSKEDVLKYKVEPYVLAADVYSTSGMQGMGGWTWYTGSASWFYLAGLEHILGIKRKGNQLTINPCIPSEWQGFQVEYNYNETSYLIDVKNPNHLSTNLISISCDGKVILPDEIFLKNDKKKHVIEVIIGP